MLAKPLTKDNKVVKFPSEIDKRAIHRAATFLTAVRIAHTNLTSGQVIYTTGELRTEAIKFYEQQTTCSSLGIAISTYIEDSRIYTELRKQGYTNKGILSAWRRLVVNAKCKL